MEKYVGGEHDVEVAELKAAIRQGCIASGLVPVLCGSA